MVNDPEIVTEVEAVFFCYEKALVTNDVATLDGLFWHDDKTVRYGTSENLYGQAEIAAFRAGRPSAGLDRVLGRTVLTTFGRDFATASTLFRRAHVPGHIGRQTQTWARLPEGWRIVAAHVSVIEEPGSRLGTGSERAAEGRSSSSSQA